MEFNAGYFRTPEVSVLVAYVRAFRGAVGEETVPLFRSRDVGRRVAQNYDCYDGSVGPPDCPNFGPSHPSYKPPSPDRPNEVPEPNKLRLYLKGRNPRSLVWGVGNLLIRSDLVPPQIAERFTGVEFREVDLFSDETCRARVEGFTEMRVTGRVRIDEEKSGVRLLYRCKICGASNYSEWKPDLGLHFEGDEHDWPDLFQMEQRPGLTFIKRRVAENWISVGFSPLTLTDVRDMKPYY